MTPRQQKALAGLLCMPTKREAAEYAGVGISTLRSYLSDESFVNEYRKAIASLLDDVTRESQQQLHSALQVLAEISADTESPPAVRVQAARAQVELSLKLTDQLSTTERLAAVEKALMKEADE